MLHGSYFVSYFPIFVSCSFFPDYFYILCICVLLLLDVVGFFCSFKHIVVNVVSIDKNCINTVEAGVLTNDVDLFADEMKVHNVEKSRDW